MSYNNQPGLDHVILLSAFSLLLIARILGTSVLSLHQNYLVSSRQEVIRNEGKKKYWAELQNICALRIWQGEGKAYQKDL